MAAGIKISLLRPWSLQPLKRGMRVVLTELYLGDIKVPYIFLRWSWTQASFDSVQFLTYP